MFIRLPLPNTLKLVCFGILISLGGPALAEIQQDIIEESKKIYQREKQYLEKSHGSDWKEMYGFQHPEFKRRVSLEEYIYFDGRVPFNYRESLRARVSGGYSIPTLEDIRQNPQKKDILGYPAPRKYRMTTNPLVNVEKFSIEKIAISKDNRFAKVTSRYTGTMFMDPSVVRAQMRVPLDINVEHFWEKVDGEWFITLLQSPGNISGNPYFYFIPNDSRAWDEKEFVEVEAGRFAQEKS